MTEQSENIGQEEKKGRSWKFWVIIGAVTLFCICPIALFMIDTDARSVGLLPTNTPEPTATSTPEPSATAEPSNTPEPTDPPPPTETLEPEAQLEADIRDVLGNVNRDGVQRIHEIKIQGERLVVEFALNDNFTQDMRARGAMIDVKDVLKVAAQSDAEFSSVFVAGTFSLVDTLGNASEERVVQAVYSREILDQVNWDNFLTDNVWEIADSVSLHPELR